MPVVLRCNGFDIGINTNDHLPPHVHVRYSGATAIIEIATRNVRKVKRMSERDMRRAQDIVEENEAFLLAAWERIGPIA